MKISRCPSCGRREKRSTEANRFYWLLLHVIAGKVRADDGLLYPADTWHKFFRSKLIGCDDVRLPNGETLTILRSTTELDVAEFAEYVGRIEAWAAERDVFLDEIENAA